MDRVSKSPIWGLSFLGDRLHLGREFRRIRRGLSYGFGKIIAGWLR
jgi:hypothetical protein